MSSTIRYFTVPLLIIFTLFGFFYQSKIAFTSRKNSLQQHQVESLKSGTYIHDNRSIPNILLVDDRGFELTAASFKRQWSIFFFGYASCPDFCPQILEQLDTLGAYVPDELVKKYFVTINPEIDTPGLLSQFLARYSHHIHGLTGSKDEIFKLVDYFHITADKTPNYAGHIEHSASLLLLNPDGKMCGIFNDLSDTKYVVEDIFYIQRRYG